MLIVRIKASNFYGVKEPVEVSFNEGGLKEKIGYVNVDKERVSLISGFYGANASGKSTILNIIDTITRIMVSRQQDFIIDPNGLRQETVISMPNLSNEMKEKPMLMEMDFIIGDNKYTYSFSLLNGGKEISEEKLIKNNKIVFSRKDTNVSLSNVVEKKVGKLAEKIVAPKKTSFLSVVLDESSDISVFGNIKEDMGISELEQIKTKFCFITDKRCVQRGQNNVSGVMSFAIRYINNEKSSKDMLKEVESVVRHFEPTLEAINIKKINDSQIEYTAKYENFYKSLPITELSAGTRELIAYISNILKVIRYGGVVVYDETSKYYHPDMEIAILNLFKDKEINKNNAQIFFSSHNHETFDLLQNDQAHIIEKTEKGIAVNKVSDYSVKERDNTKKIYRLGSLGGVPDTIDFNRVINNLV